ncbi:hypothetical protein ACIP93_33755 [Streptomyces sp. NPDC088745]|uniref:hypothetical protein n=1 Tax=Streptomyces sp. NPDC088745 TaxID=3365884 RepID=UPI003809BE99
MPRRTMLPPNLTRHLHETRRLLAEADGRELPAWYRLTPAERATAEMDMEVFRRAILRAEEEQDLVAAYNAGADVDPAPATADSRTVENCPCAGCSTVAAVLELLKQARRLEDRLQPRREPNPDSLADATASGPGRGPTPQEPDETARARKLAQDAVARWMAGSRPSGPLTAPTEPHEAVWTFQTTPVTAVNLYRAMDESAQRWQDALRWDVTNLGPIPPGV